MLVSGTYLTMARVERIDQLTSPQITVNTTSTYQNHQNHPPPTPPSPKLRAAYGALNACSHLTPTHQLAERHHQTSPCTAQARNLAYTAARGQGRRNVLLNGFKTLPHVENRVSQAQEVRIGWNRG